MENIELKINEFVNLLNNHLSCNNNFYIDPLVITKIIVDRSKLYMSYDNIKKYIRNINIKITEQEIKEYLNKKLESDNPNLKERIENKNYIMLNKSEKSMQEFMDRLMVLKYSFDPYTLEYFKKYVEILREKSLKLFNLVDKIQDNRINGWCFDEETTEEWNIVLDELNQYDIKLNEDGFIYYEDLIRLVTPLIQNVLDLKEKVQSANNLETYLTFKLSKNDLYKDGFIEDDYYPRRELQVNDALYNNERGYIPLSEEQRERLIKCNLDNFSACVDFIDDSLNSEKNKVIKK